MPLHQFTDAPAVEPPRRSRPVPKIRLGLEMEREQCGSYSSDWPTPPPGWWVKSDCSVRNGAEYVFADDAICLWSPGDAMPELWAAAETVQTFGRPGNTAGTHVHISVPGLDRATFQRCGEAIVLKYRDHLRRAVNAVDAERAVTGGYHDAWNQPDIPNSHGHDVVWSAHHGTFELRLFSSRMTHTQVWDAIQPILTDLADAAAYHLAKTA